MTTVAYAAVEQRGLSFDRQLWMLIATITDRAVIVRILAHLGLPLRGARRPRGVLGGLTVRRNRVWRTDAALP
jgi:hypothetical protein